METTTDTPVFEKTLDNALSLAKTHNWDSELIGQWLWVTFSEKPDQATRDTLKAAGFRWHTKRMKWYFPGCPKHPFSHKHFSFPEMRNLFGTDHPEKETFNANAIFA